MLLYTFIFFANYFKLTGDLDNCLLYRYTLRASQINHYHCHIFIARNVLKTRILIHKISHGAKFTYNTKNTDMSVAHKLS